MGLLRNIRYLLRTAEIDNGVYKLHYRLTVLILVVFSFIITCRLVLGDSFSCTTPRDIPEDIIETFCYAKSPYVILQAFLKNSETLYPGVAKRSTGDHLIVKSFYPWVNLFFLVLAVIFYLPHLAWKIYERRLVARVTCDIDRPLDDEISRESAISGIVKFLKSMQGKTAMYATVYITTEMLNFMVDVLLTTWLVFFFQISKKSTKILDLKVESWDEFFEFYFPLAGKCTFNTYGSSGTLVTFDVLCLMPLNKLYGFMFLFLYAWFIMLCVVSPCVVLYRTLVFLIPVLRLKLLRYLLLGVDHNLLLRLDKQYSFGDILLLNFLKKNLLPHDFAKLVHFLIEKEHIGD